VEIISDLKYHSDRMSKCPMHFFGGKKQDVADWALLLLLAMGWLSPAMRCLWPASCSL